VFSAQIENQAKFFFDWKVFSNFYNGKQTQESLESGFPETTFRKTVKEPSQPNSLSY
jgi:hypothetical protein